jgi:hypothetical protein
VANAIGEPKITEALGQSLGQPQREVSGTEQQSTTVRRDRTGISAHYFAVSASGIISIPDEVVAAQQFSLSRSADAPRAREKFR